MQTLLRNFRDFEWTQFFVRLYKRFSEVDLLDRSAQTAFYFTFSLFPLLFFIVSVVGITIGSADALRNEMFSYLRQIMPYVVFTLVQKTVEEIVQNSSGTKVAIGLILAWWAASAGVDGIRSALNAIYELREYRSWWHTKIISLLLTLATIVLVSLVLVVVFYGWKVTQSTGSALGIVVKSPWLVAMIQWITILAIMLFACELIYNLLPAYRRRKWSWMNIGSVVAIIAWLLLSGGFRLYLSFFNSYDRTYGSLGAVIVMMLWLYLTAMVVMVGGLINSVLADLAAEREPPLE